MALKDKLITLEDFKAVRDVDVASNSAQFKEIKADLGDQTGIISKNVGYYINLTVDPVDISNPSPSSTGLTCAVVDCSEGDKFVVNAVGATSGRAWGFLDSSNHVLSMADANATVTDLELTAPTNAVKLIINDKGGGMSYKVGSNIASRVAALEAAKTGLSDDVKAALLECFGAVYWSDGRGAEHYSNLENVLYGIITYRLGFNLFATPGSYNTDYNNNSRVRVSFADNFTSKRRVFYANAGNTAIKDVSGNATNLYPIPIPVGVTWAKCTITPSQRNIALYAATYDSTLQEFVDLSSGEGWKEGESYIIMPGISGNRYLLPMSRYNSSNAAYSEEPTAVVIEFGTEYKLGRNLTVSEGNATISNGNIVFNTESSWTSKRRTFFTTIGRRAARDTSDAAVAKSYPIPLPVNVSKVKASITPSSRYIALYILEYDVTNKTYSEYTPTRGFEEGSTEYDITSTHGELYALPVSKYDSAGSTYATEPTDLVVEIS